MVDVEPRRLDVVQDPSAGGDDGLQQLGGGQFAVAAVAVVAQECRQADGSEDDPDQDAQGPL